MDKKTILAFALSFVVLVGWSLFFSPQPEKKPPKESSTENVQPAPEPQKSPVTISPAAPSKTVAVVGQPAVQQEEKKITIDTPLYSAVFSNVGPTIKSFKLKKYRQTVNPESPFVEMVTLEEGMGDYLTILFDDSSDASTQNISFSADKDSLTLQQGSEPATIVFRGTNRNGCHYPNIPFPSRPIWYRFGRDGRQPQYGAGQRRFQNNITDITA